jgi:hypothetical protein
MDNESADDNPRPSASPVMQAKERTFRPHRGHRKKVQEPPFGKCLCANPTSRSTPSSLTQTDA